MSLRTTLWAAAFAPSRPTKVIQGATAVTSRPDCRRETRLDARTAGYEDLLMTYVLGVSSAEVVGWVCFIIGAVGVLTGGVFGVLWARGEAHTTVAAASDKSKKEEIVKGAKSAVAELSTTAKTAAKEAPSEGKEDEAAQKASAAQSAVDELAAIIKALPERLRFWGFLILVGGLLMSVATIEFSGHAIF